MKSSRECKTCLNCGEQFVAKKKTAQYCSQNCRGVVEKQCAVCAKSFKANSKRKMCSEECRMNGKNRHPKRGSVKNCESCRNKFIVKEGRYSRTCGRKCAAALRIHEGTNSNLHITGTWQHKLKRWVKLKNRKWRKGICKQCGNIRVTKQGRCIACVDRLSGFSLSELKKQVVVMLRRFSTPCAACGGTRQFWSTFCLDCKKKRARDICTHGNHRKRCAKYGGQYEKGITIRRIAKRDGMTCHYCGIMTRRWAGRLNSDTTTMDHVYPLSKGGDHTMENTVIACAECNSKKGVKCVTLF